MSRFLALILAALVLAARRTEPLVVGSKESVQNRILAEMFARLLEDAGLPVERRLGLGDSVEAFAALRGGTIDLS